MKLFYSTTSPFARKVRICALLLNPIGLELIKTNPLEDESLRKINPLGKVPALEDNGFLLADSPLICEYLNSLSMGASGIDLFRKTSDEYFRIQSLHAQANGILDAAVATVMEHRRTDSEQSKYWLDRWHKSIKGTLAIIDIQHCGTRTDVHIGTIALLCALDYLSFRLPDLLWREENPKLASLFDVFGDAPWFTETDPRAC